MKKTLNSISSSGQIISFLKQYFNSIPDPREAKNISVPIGDAVMSAYAMFSLKFPSLLKFEKDIKDEAKKNNLKNMFEINEIVSDTQMRAIIDEIPTSLFRNIYKDLFSKLQRDKKLVPYEFIKINNIPYYQLLLDGTEFFSSHDICCENCNVKVHKKIDKKTGEITESKTYSHSMLNAVIAHPDIKTVIPLMGEPIVKQKGETKYDCELKALKRFLKKFREDHPKLKVVLVADALYATGSLIELLKQYEIKFIINVKPKKHKVLFSIVDIKDGLNEVSHHNEHRVIGKKILKDQKKNYKYINKVPVDNESSTKFKVNFLEYWENTTWINSKKENCSDPKHFSWVTDITLDKNNIEKITLGGRNRWMIENEVFNTLKNSGYHYDRNFGHGYKNLSNNFATLMMLAFTIDQILETNSKKFKILLKKFRLKGNFWEKIRSYFTDYLIESWECLLDFLIQLAQGPIALSSNTS